MKKNLFLSIIFLTLFTNIYAQHFIDKAVIEYEVKANLRKSMGSGMWADMMKDKLPEFNVGYYTLTFANNKSIYKFDHWDKSAVPEYFRKPDEGNVWFYDFNKGEYNKQKNIYGSNINISDSIQNLHWKLSNENRMIAGFNCRKATAILFDSVYVFAFYTEEMTFPGGPFSINGLPGTILGVTIPRLYTSWIATKVMVNNVNENVIKPITAKKIFSKKEFKDLLDERTKDWYYNTTDANELKEMQEEKARFMWNSFL
ncbi:MAG: GLPGLI family protein [Ginsengibacter sp.]|jgi:GLPGLI family protein